MRKFSYLVVTLLALVACNAQSMDLRIDSEGDAEFVLMSGRIVKGDADRVVILMMRNLANNEKFVVNYRIESDGGDVAEAIKIGSLMRGLYATIKVPINKVCASSCFLVWINGAFRMAGTREFPSAGLLAVHRPYYLNDGGKNVSTEKQGVRQVEAMKVMRTYLEDNLVPRSLTDEMMSRPSNDAYVLTARDIGMLGEIPPWFEEVSIAKCGYRRNLVTDIVNAGMRGDNAEKERLRALDSKIIECQHETARAARLAYLSRLISGWRPWTGK